MSIKTNVRIAINEALEYVHTYQSTHAVIPEKYKNLVSAEILMEHINFILNNIYFSNTPDIVLKQICGITMVTNGAPELANLTLYVTEAASHYIQKICIH